MRWILFCSRCVLAIIPLVISLPVCAQDKSTPRKLESVTLGLSAGHVLNLPIYLAQRHGIFESEGFDFKPITTKTSIAIAALVSGDLDYITAFNSGLGAAIGGAPLVATYVSTDKPLLYLISRPDIKDAKALARRDHRPWRYPREPLSRNRGDGEISRIGRRERCAVDFDHRRHPGLTALFSAVAAAHTVTALRFHCAAQGITTG